MSKVDLPQLFIVSLNLTELLSVRQMIHTVRCRVLDVMKFPLALCNRSHSRFQSAIFNRFHSLSLFAKKKVLVILRNVHAVFLFFFSLFFFFSKLFSVAPIYNLQEKKTKLFASFANEIFFARNHEVDMKMCSKTDLKKKIELNSNKCSTHVRKHNQLKNYLQLFFSFR